MFYIFIKCITQNSHLRYIGLYGILLLLIIFTNNFEPAFILATSVMMLCFAASMILADNNFFEF